MFVKHKGLKCREGFYPRQYYSTEPSKCTPVGFTKDRKFF